jgi:hypothetical protein
VSELSYSRARDKSDKSVEVYKFFINALYVAVTRATGAVYLVESDQEHPLLRLLSVAFSESSNRVAASESSKEEWQREARKLELQGKTEQAEAIREGLLRQVPVPWEVIDAEAYERASRAVFEPSATERARRTVFELAALHEDHVLFEKMQQVLGYRCTDKLDAQHDKIFKSERAPYSGRNFRSVLDLVERHGVELRTAANLTPLMLAAAAGNPDLVDALLSRGASLTATDHFGRMPMHFALEQALRDPHFARFGIGSRVGPAHARDARPSGGRSPRQAGAATCRAKLSACVRATPRGGEPDWLPVFTLLGRSTLELHTLKGAGGWTKHPSWVRIHEPSASTVGSGGRYAGLTAPESRITVKAAPVWRSSSKKRRR